MFNYSGSVDSIIQSFKKTIDRLDLVSDTNREQYADLTSKAVGCKSEWERADSISSKLKIIFGE